MFEHVLGSAHLPHVEDRGQHSEAGLFLQCGSQNPIKIARPGGKCPYSLSLSLALGLMFSIKVPFWIG